MDFRPSPLNSRLTSFLEVDDETLRKIIRAINDKTSKHDTMPTKCVKTCTDELLPIIKSPVNGIIRSGAYP